MAASLRGGGGPGDKALRRAAWISFEQARVRLDRVSTVVIDADIESGGRAFISLGQAGAQVRIARGLAQGLHLVQLLRPGLVVLCTHLPDGDSLAAVAGLLSAGPPPPAVVALAPVPSRPARRRFLAAGCAGFLHKPVDLHLFAQHLALELLD